MGDDILVTAGVVFGLVVLAAFVWSLTWVYRDAGSRGKTAVVWLLIAFFTWPFGVIVYAMLRGRPVTL